MSLDALSDEIKALAPDPTAFLSAAMDSGDGQLMAMGILAHPRSIELQGQTVGRLFAIGFLDGLPAPTEITNMRKIATLFLDHEVRS